MSASNAEIDATSEIGIDRFVLWLTTSSGIGVHRFNIFSEFTVNTDGCLEIQPAALESVKIKIG